MKTIVNNFGARLMPEDVLVEVTCAKICRKC